MIKPAIAALLAAAPFLSASAQSPAAPPPLDAAARRETVDTIAALFERLYVSADTGRMIGGRIRRQLRTRAYDSLTDVNAFAEALTADLRAVNGDLHLAVQFAPGDGMPRPGLEGLPTTGDPSDTMPPPPALLALWRRTNFGFERTEILPGNVGYVAVTGFPDGAEATAAALSAVQAVAHADAIIFDFRRMPGGSDVTSNFLLSHFLRDSLPSLRVTNRSANRSVVRYTLARVPGPRRLDVPLYVLTSRATVSAGEDFTFVLHNQRRATIVGERTAGAGHNNAFIDAGHGFVVSISYTRVTDPRSGKEWERVGVTPDVVTDPDSALAVAHLAALSRLAREARDPMERGAAERAREYAAARYRGDGRPASALARYAGRYEGGREVTFAGGRLWYRRAPGMPSDELVMISDSVFAPLPGARLVFSEGRKGGAVTLRLLRPDGPGPSFRRLAAR